jgi:acetate kinase
MKILVLNAGSWSLKFELIDTAGSQLLGRGIIERIGAAQAAMVSFDNCHGARKRYAAEIAGYSQAAEAALDCLTDPRDGVIKGPAAIEGVGHRIVHGGEHLSDSVRIDENTIRLIEQCSDLAPLHNPLGLKGIRAAQRLLPGVPQVAVFDTSFHSTLPAKAYLYGLPYSYYTQYRIRRYGFHGTSHRYVSRRFAQIHGAAPEDLKLITCHLGNGCSMCAVEYGRSVDTSMGFTPLEGLLMGTRCGDIDAAVIPYLVTREGLDIDEVDALLNKRSGLYGLSGLTNDMRDLLAAGESGHVQARLAVEVFCYRVKKYIGAYFALLDGADAIIFTGGIGENAPPVRARICDSLTALGVRLDPARNEAARGVEAGISAAGQPVAVWVIPTNESLLIAQEAARLIGGEDPQ